MDTSEDAGASDLVEVQKDEEEAEEEEDKDKTTEKREEENSLLTNGLFCYEKWFLKIIYKLNTIRSQ